MVAMGQRNAGVSRAGERCGDAGHDFVGDAVGAQEFEFLAAATEHERIAALEPHHALACARVLQHQRMDAVLAGVMRAGLLADFDEFRIAPRECEHLGADQAVVQDHVGFVERAQTAQRQQARIAGPRTDQHDRATSGVRCVRRKRIVEHASGCSGLSLPQALQQRAFEQAFEKTPAFAQIRKPCADALAFARQQCSQRAERMVDPGFEPLAQMARKHRCAAAAGDRDLQRPALDSRRHMEARCIGIVHHVDENPSRLACDCNGCVDRGIVGRRDCEPCIVEPCICEIAMTVFDGPGAFECREFLDQSWRTDPYPRSGLNQGLGLASCHRTAADHQHSAAAQIGEQRKQLCLQGSHVATTGDWDNDASCALRCMEISKP